MRARLASELSPEIQRHVEATAALARRLAAAHGVDADRAELVGLLHDVAHELSERRLLQLAAEYEIPVDAIEARVPKLLHGAVGAEILRRDWGIGDAELLDAVRSHVTGSPGMGLLAKVVFVADKLEPSRDRYYGGLNGTRGVAFRDLDAAILELHAWRLSTLVQQERPIHERLVASRNLLMEKLHHAIWD